MTDDELRKLCESGIGWLDDDVIAARKEIPRLLAEKERLRKALEKIASVDPMDDGVKRTMLMSYPTQHAAVYRMVHTARAALEHGGE